MNSVHLVTQEKYGVKNQVEKPSRLHEPPTGPACAPGTRTRAVSWPAQRRVLAKGWSYRGRGSRPYRHAPRRITDIVPLVHALCAAACSARPLSLHARAPRACRSPALLPLAHSPQPAATPSPAPSPAPTCAPFPIAIQFVSCNTNPSYSSSSSHDTMFVS